MTIRLPRYQKDNAGNITFDARDFNAAYPGRLLPPGSTVNGTTVTLEVKRIPAWLEVAL